MEPSVSEGLTGYVSLPVLACVWAFRELHILCLLKSRRERLSRTEHVCAQMVVPACVLQIVFNTLRLHWMHVVPVILQQRSSMKTVARSSC